MLKAMPFLNYMKDVREKYKKVIKTEVPKQYFFKNKKLRNLEDLYRKSDVNMFKKVPIKVIDIREKG